MCAAHVQLSHLQPAGGWWLWWSSTSQSALVAATLGLVSVPDEMFPLAAAAATELTCARHTSYKRRH